MSEVTFESDDELRRVREENDALRQQVTALALFVEELAAAQATAAERARELLRLVHQPDATPGDSERT